METERGKYNYGERAPNTILAVDGSSAVNEAQNAEWEKYGIRTARVDTMEQAVARLARGDEFLLVAVNEDTVPDFMPRLPVMRDITNLPIYVITSNYTVEKKIKALRGGADAYEPFDRRANKNVLAAVEQMRAQKRRAEAPVKNPPVLIERDIILSRSMRSVIVENAEIPLARKEFDLLLHLMQNAGRVIPHAQLLRAVWGDEYGERDANVLWRAMNRLRKKLSASSPNRYIKVVKNIGYKFLL